MDSMKSTYLEEAFELLEKMETSLLLLESTPNDDELIEDVFRSMHTLKGSSAMFGFDKVAAFVHHLESIYDKIREGQLKVTKVLLNATLASIDHLKKIVEDTELEDPTNVEDNKNITIKILALLGEKPKAEKEEVNIVEKETNEKTFYISFKPHEDIFKNGTNPLYILDELTGMGTCEVFPRFQDVKDLDALNPEKCYSYWEILLATSSDENEVKDVFLFVESDSEIKVEEVCSYNVLAIDEASDLLQPYLSFEKEAIDLEALKEQAENHKPATSQGTVEASATPTNGTVAASKEKSKEKGISSIRVASDKIDSLMSIVSELVTTQAGLSLFSENTLNPELEVIAENIEKLSRQLRDVAFGMTLIPIKNIMSRFQRLVRDVSSDLGKDVDFKTQGDETELDKSIIESLTDPLMHILRNSLDHGIESAEVRKAAGKPEKGTIMFKAFYSGASVHIQIQDDGKGLDVAKIKEKAIAKGIIAEDAQLTDKEAFQLIFYPGFSTAAVVTDVSGRGVGMDVVRKNIESLRGEIDIDSVKGKGTTLTLKLPLTLSIIDGLLVEIAGTNYVVPLSVVDKCYEVKYEALENNFKGLLTLDDVPVPFINLRKEFMVYDEKPEFTQLIVVNNGERKVGLSVDHIVGEYQAVLKPLGKYYQNQDYLSGATILGDGTIALVFDTNKIVSKFSVKEVVEN